MPGFFTCVLRIRTQVLTLHYGLQTDTFICKHRLVNKETRRTAWSSGLLGLFKIELLFILFMHTHVHLCVCGRICASVEAGVDAPCLPSSFSKYTLSLGHLLGTELTASADPASQLVPETLPTLSVIWDYRCPPSPSWFLGF